MMPSYLPIPFSPSISWPPIALSAATSVNMSLHYPGKKAMLLRCMTWKVFVINSVMMISSKLVHLFGKINCNCLGLT